MSIAQRRIRVHLLKFVTAHTHKWDGISCEYLIWKNWKVLKKLKVPKKCLFRVICWYLNVDSWAKWEIEICDETSRLLFKQFCGNIHYLYSNDNGLLQLKASAKNDAYSTAFRLTIPPVTLYYRYLIIQDDFLIPCFLHLQRCTIRLLYDGSSIELASWLAMAENRLSSITMVFHRALLRDIHFPRHSRNTHDKRRWNTVQERVCEKRKLPMDKEHTSFRYFSVLQWGKRLQPMDVQVGAEIRFGASNKWAKKCA